MQKQPFAEIDILKNSANFTEKVQYWSPFLIKFIKKILQHRCFSVKFAKFFKNTYFYNTSGDSFCK